MFGFKLWSVKPKKVLINKGSYLSVYNVDLIREQKIKLYDYLILQSNVLEAQALNLRKEAKSLLE